MRNTLERIKRHSKKGTTLVELVVAMTLTLIFAVVCVALINPIERTYQNVEKMSRAQLLADTIIDSIRKECDDVQYDDPNAVWLVAAGNSADDDQMLFAVPSSKPASGNVLVIKKDNKYCEAIYSCFPISAQNISNLTANPADGSTSAHAASTLTGDNLNRGLVHFGYYQGKYSKDGLYPFKAYDYTNPVTASTYGDYTVALLFERVGCKTINGVEYPAFVECTVKVYKGDYNNGGEFIYSRTAAVCFSANGSAQGSAGNIDTSSTTHVRDYNVVIEWDDGNAADRPASVVVKLCDDLNDLDPSNDVVLRTHTLDTTKTRFVFADVKTTGKAYIIVPDFPGYTTMGPISRSDGFYVKYQRSDSAKLIRGIDLRNKMSTAVTNVIFGLKSDPVLAEAVKNASRSEMVARNADDTLSDKYMLYIVDGTDEEGNPKKTAYILSDEPVIVLNEDSSQMFWDCTQLKQITGLEMLDTSNVIDMHRMFKNCKKLSQDFILTNWDTSNVQAFDSMFYNVGTDVPDDTRMTINVSSFDFRSARDYGTGSDNMPIVGINKMFYAEGGLTSHIETIIFPTDPEKKKMVNVPRIQQVFHGCDHLVNLENFNNIDFSGLVPVEDPYKTIEYIFGECVSLKELDLSNWNCPNVETIDFLTTGNKIDGLKNLEKLDMSGLVLSDCSSLNGMLNGLKSIQEIDFSDSDFSGVTNIDIFKGKTTLTKVDLSGCTSGITSVAGMFYNCSNLETVDLTGVINSNVTSIASVFEGCNKLNNANLNGWDTSNVTDMSYAFKNCHTNTADNFEISLAGLDFSNVVNMTEMFNGTGASVISFPNGANFSKVENIDGLFRNCKGLTTINGFQNVEFPLVTDASSLFGGCSKLQSANFGLKLPNALTIENMFSNCSSLTSIDLELDFPAVENINGLFSGCTGLTTVNLELDFDKVTSANSLFNGCTSLSSVTLDMDLPSATEIKNIFAGCTTLKTIDLTVDAPNATDASYLFSGCTSLNSLDMDLNLPNVTNISYMFNNCKGFTTMDLELSFDKVTNASYLFNGCSNLSTLDLKLDLPAATDISKMFSGCSSLKNLKAEMDIPSVTGMNKFFDSLSSLTTIDLSKSDFSGLTVSSYLFNSCAKLTDITLDEVDMSNCVTTGFTFNNCNAITHISMKNANACNAESASFLLKDTVQYIDITGTDFSSVTTLKSIASNKKKLVEFIATGANFASCTSIQQAFAFDPELTTVDFSNVIFDECTSASDMFNGCAKLQTVNFSNVTMNKCTTTEQMFNNCYRLYSINMKNFVTPNNKSCKNMFKNCYSARVCDFSGWDTSSVTTMEAMFFNFCYCDNNYCKSKAKATVDISSFDLGSVTTMYQMFQCDKPENGKEDCLEVLKFPSASKDGDPVAASVQNLSYMFRFRKHLLRIDNLGEFTATAATVNNMQYMFSNVGASELDVSGINLDGYKGTGKNMFDTCANLTTIYVAPGTDWSTVSFSDTTNMFLADTNLVGKDITGNYPDFAFDSNYKKKEYARVNGLNGKNGYFTAKSA